MAPWLIAPSAVPPPITPMTMYGTSRAAWTAKMTVPIWLHSQRSRNIWTGVMNPCRRPSAQMRVPASSRNNGVTRPAAVAINPKVTIPFAKAWPDEPSTAKAVMCVPKRDVRKT
jgi:hypothetical protein